MGDDIGSIGRAVAYYMCIHGYTVIECGDGECRCGLDDLMRCRRPDLDRCKFGYEEEQVVV